MKSEDRLAELRTLLQRLGQLGMPPTDIELRYLRSLLASTASATADRACAGSAESLRILDAVLDSPLDVDRPVLESLRSTLESGSSPGQLRGGETATLVSQMRQTNRVLQQQAQRVQQGRLVLEKARAGVEAVAKRHPAKAALQAKFPVLPAPLPARKTIRGLHVRQGGHDFVLPVEKIERALAVDVSQLPTVHGHAVAHVSGEVFDVVDLAGQLGLSTRGVSSAGTLIVVSKSGRKACLVIDEVVGPVEVALTPLERVLSGVTTILDVASLKSGGLALVPNFSRLLR